MIIECTDAKIEDGGSGAFYIYLKNKFKIKWLNKNKLYIYLNTFYDYLVGIIPQKWKHFS
jgi:hypothetical protein